MIDGNNTIRIIKLEIFIARMLVKGIDIIESRNVIRTKIIGTRV